MIAGLWRWRRLHPSLTRLTRVPRYENVDFCDVHELPGLGDLSGKFGMIWRFMPLADDSVERFIVRDLDSLIGWVSVTSEGINR